jgi:hypothetical protein
MAEVDNRVATVNDRVSDVVSRFEAYILGNAQVAAPTTLAQSHNVINATQALPIASDS